MLEGLAITAMAVSAIVVAGLVLMALAWASDGGLDA
jgi:hypothetical protein